MAVPRLMNRIRFQSFLFSIQHNYTTIQFNFHQSNNCKNTVAHTFGEEEVSGVVWNCCNRLGAFRCLLAGNWEDWLGPTASSIWSCSVFLSVKKKQKKSICHMLVTNITKTGLKVKQLQPQFTPITDTVLWYIAQTQLDTLKINDGELIALNLITLFPNIPMGSLDHKGAKRPHRPVLRLG